MFYRDADDGQATTQSDAKLGLTMDRPRAQN